ncbi:Uncharacterised protein [Mycobacteroides abscessus subsp. abscessus]|nr:Uncharacterised protein [Mycobacteroides abscessus subsp. abscessus]
MDLKEAARLEPMCRDRTVSPKTSPNTAAIL